MAINIPVFQDERTVDPHQILIQEHGEEAAKVNKIKDFEKKTSNVKVHKFQGVFAGSYIHGCHGLWDGNVLLTIDFSSL